MTASPKLPVCLISCWAMSALGGAMLAYATKGVLPTFISVGLGIAFAIGGAMFLQRNICGAAWDHWGPFEGLKGVPGWDEDEPEPGAGGSANGSAAPSDAATAAPAAKAPAEPVAATPVEEEPSVSVDTGSASDDGNASSGAADDLKKLNGIGPKLEALLNENGVHRFEQIAAWTPDDVAAIEDKLSFKGRIERDGWIAQAKELASGG